MKWRINRPMFSWALYDWANSAFATTVIAGFFPVFLKEYWYPDAAATESTFALSVGNSLGGLLVALAAPVLGAIADRGSAKRKFLFTLAVMGMAATATLPLIQQGQYVLAIGIYVVAMFGFECATTFYDSLLVGLTDESNKEFLSALGYAMGYLGGGLLFTVNVLMSTKPEWFGLADAAQGVRLSFLTVAVWWAVFTIPLFLWVKEPPVPNPVSGRAAVRAGLRQLIDTLREIGSLKITALFLLAYWLYIDGVHTIVRMAVDYGMALGFPSESLIVALLITQFVGFPATILVGKLGEKIGPKRGLYVCIGVYALITVFGYFMTAPLHFYLLAVTIGLVQGGSQALSRSYYVSLIPKPRAAQFFGFYNMLGKFAAVLGPALVGLVALATGSSRLSILSLLILFALGAALLALVNTQKGAQAVREFERRLEAAEAKL